MTDWKTKLIHAGAHAPEGFQSLAEPVHRGSTVLFPSAGEQRESWDHYEGGYAYGTHGTPTVLELASRVCELEGGYRTWIVPCGLASITLVNLALLSAGDHLLLPANVYGPSRRMAAKLLSRLGVEWSLYPPLAGEGIREYLRPNTRLVWCEAPGSVTMEVPDVPAMARVAHEAGALVAVDNTWAAGVLFDALGHGADVTMQALSKYVGGHSDLLLGSVTARNAEIWQKLGDAHCILGLSVSPDEASLALRGLKTMAVRLEAIEARALELARWLAERPEIERVLHPALESCPGHENWKRDFTGSSGVFSIVFREGTRKEQVHGFVDALKLFGIGYSWGGVSSLALTYDFTHSPERPGYGNRLVRLNIGLESVEDLRADLGQALRVGMGLG